MKYKDLLLNLVERDLKLKYKRSFFGFLWSLVNPLIMLIIYTWVFKSILKNDIPNFSLFLMAGLLPWNFFASSLSTSAGVFTSNASLLTKVKIPKYILVISNIVYNLAIFLMMILLMLIAKIFFGVPYTSSIFYLPLAVILQLIFMFSLGIIVSISNVFFHDTAHLIEVLLMAWFWLTPIIYQFNLIPIDFQIYVALNPMSLIINLYQTSISEVPIYTEPYAAILFIMVTAIIAIVLYKKYDNKISEIV